MSGPSCCERYDDLLLGLLKVMLLLLAAFLVVTDNPAPFLFLTEETGPSGV
jgi:hypothetical protein